MRDKKGAWDWTKKGGGGMKYRQTLLGACLCFDGWKKIKRKGGRDFIDLNHSGFRAQRLRVGWGGG